MMITKKFQSQNYDARAPGSSLKYIVLHYTAMNDAAEAIKWLCNPASKVSSHYVIDEEGEIFSLLSEEHRAWHAGTPSFWKNEEDINSRSIGIELSNLGTHPFSRKQIDKLCRLLFDIIGRHSLNPLNILGHSDVAPQRKIDPGPFFPWRYLAHQGLGLWAGRQNLKQKSCQALEVQQNLQRFGYECPLSGLWDRESQNVFRAFLLHFYPELWRREQELFIKEAPQHMQKKSGYVNALLERLLERRVCF